MAVIEPKKGAVLRVALLFVLLLAIGWIVRPTVVNYLGANQAETLRNRDAAMVVLSLPTLDEVKSVDVATHVSLGGLDISFFLNTFPLGSYDATQTWQAKDSAQVAFTNLQSSNAEARCQLLFNDQVHYEWLVPSHGTTESTSDTQESPLWTLPSGSGDVRVECHLPRDLVLAQTYEGYTFRTPDIRVHSLNFGSGGPNPPFGFDLYYEGPVAPSTYVRYASPSLPSLSEELAEAVWRTEPKAPDQGKLRVDYDPMAGNATMLEVTASFGDWAEDAVKQRKLFLTAALLGVVGGLLIELLAQVVSAVGSPGASGPHHYNLEVDEHASLHDAVSPPLRSENQGSRGLADDADAASMPYRRLGASALTLFALGLAIGVVRIARRRK